MVTTYTNIDTLQYRKQNNYPFTKQSTLLLDNVHIDTSQIISFSLQVTSGIFPLFIGSILNNNQFIIAEIKDMRSDSIAFIHLFNNRCLIKDRNNNICGFILEKTPGYLYRLFKAFTATSSYRELDNNCLQIAPCCITCIHYKGVQSLNINGSPVQNPVILAFCNNVTAQRDISNNFSINVYGDLDLSYLSIPKLKYIAVGENQPFIDFTAQNITIKPAALSDLRIVTQNKKITFKGVKDVT